MQELLGKAGLFQGLTREEIQRLVSIARPQSAAAGEYLCLLGDAADRLWVVAHGKVDLCFPLSLQGVTKDITVESADAGETFGWSALVRPHRFTLSARVSEASELVAFTRHDLQALFDAEPRIGYTILTRISELVGVRLLRVQALWVRELQRLIEHEAARRAE